MIDGIRVFVVIHGMQGKLDGFVCLFCDDHGFMMSVISN